MRKSSFALLTVALTGLLAGCHYNADDLQPAPVAQTDHAVGSGCEKHLRTPPEKPDNGPQQYRRQTRNG